MLAFLISFSTNPKKGKELQVGIDNSRAMHYEVRENKGIPKDLYAYNLQINPCHLPKTVLSTNTQKSINKQALL